MKIICIARNYSEHAAEMGAPRFAPGSREAVSPAFFLKPDSALLLKNQPFFYPDFSHQVEYEVEVVVRIDKVGKSIDERFAHRYYSSVALGIDFTARDLQREAKAKGLPWTLSKGFDGSAALSEFVPLAELGGDIQNLAVSGDTYEFDLVDSPNPDRSGNTAFSRFCNDIVVREEVEKELKDYTDKVTVDSLDAQYHNIHVKAVITDGKLKELTYSMKADATLKIKLGFAITGTGNLDATAKYMNIDY